jgi:hypothetical protein
MEIRSGDALRLAAVPGVRTPWAEKKDTHLHWPSQIQMRAVLANAVMGHRSRS